MLLKVVVVVPLSPSNTACWNCQTRPVQIPFCSQCFLLQDINNYNHFQILDIPETFIHDSKALQEKFISLSKQFHPDRYIQSSPREANFALRWSIALNRAYQTVRDPLACAKYLLSLHQIPELKQSSVPLELAETYFELQETTETKALEKFKNTLLEEKANLQKDWDALGTQTLSRKELGLLQRLLIRQRFLDSMVEDIDKKVSHDSRN